MRPAKRPPMTSLERRLNDAAPPPPDTPLRTCHTCLAVYLDYPDGRDAHVVVFKHHPSVKEAESA